MSIRIIWFLTALCLAGFGTYSSSAIAAPSSVYSSLISAIDSANSQARLTFSPGIWRTKVGEALMTWEFPVTNHANLVVEYEEGQISSGSIEFDTAIFVVIRTPDGVCSRIRIKQINYKYGGGFDGNSDFHLDGPANCANQNGLALLQDHLRLTNRSQKLFSGSIFVSLANAITSGDPERATLVKCSDLACTTISIGRGPVTYVSFYGTKKDGVKYLPFKAVLKRNGVVVLPNNNGYFKIADAATVESSVKITQLDYDFVQDQGSATLDHLGLQMSEGQMSSGRTLLKFPAGSAISFDNVIVEKGSDGVSLQDGTFKGKLARGSIIEIQNDTVKSSFLTIDSVFDVSLVKLEAKFSKDEQWIAAHYGFLDVQLSGADIWLNSENNVNLSFLRMTLTLGCPDGDAANCLPIKWSPKSTSLTGTISPFAADIIGGKWAISKSMKVDILNGVLKTKLLTIDSRQKETPIVGSIDLAQITFTTQDLAFEDGTKLRGGKVTLESNDLAFQKDDKFPAGTINISGTVTEVQGPNLGGLTFENAIMTIRVKRASKDDPRIETGTIEGLAVVRFADNRYGKLRVKVYDIRYYRGQGDAKLDLVSESFAYFLTVPGKQFDAEAGGDLGVNAHVDVKDLPIDLTLAQPLEARGIELKAAEGKWGAGAVTAIPIALNLHITDREAVYVRVEEKVGHINLCNPKANTDDKNYRLSGLIDIVLGSSGGKVRLYNTSISEGLKLHQVASCGDVARALCWMIGSAVTANPIAGIGLAIWCGKEVTGFEKDAIEDVRKKSEDTVNSFRFESHI
jgi:hypothetical protein